jgi:hypothetical protein
MSVLRQKTGAELPVSALLAPTIRDLARELTPAHGSTTREEASRRPSPLCERSCRG